jgi:transketolase
VVTAEEHNILGGLGESIARVLALNNPSPQEFVAVNDSFGESGTPAQLMDKYKLNNEAMLQLLKGNSKKIVLIQLMLNNKNPLAQVNGFY